MAAMPSGPTSPHPTCTSASFDCLPTARSLTARKQDQAPTGTLRSQGQRPGSILIVHPGHPLAGQTLPVVRRYREHGERLWVIELPDGSRQYVPASWCAPLAPSSEIPSSAGEPSVGRLPPEPPASPLSLAALRELAALVRHLRARGEVRGEEHGDDAMVESRRQGDRHRANAAGATDRPASAGRAAALGEFPTAGSPPPGQRDRPDGAAAGAESTGAGPRSGAGVNEP
jgi:hypothetical protein